MKKYLPLILLFIAAMALVACGGSLPELPTRTPPAVPVADSVASAESSGSESSSGESDSSDSDGGAVQTAVAEAIPVSMSAAGAAVKAVDLLGAWVDGGAPETDPFDYEGADGSMYQGTFEADILPLFTANGLWFDGAQACSGCHFANSEASYHEMDLTSYAGIMAGGDVLSEPPGVPILGQSEFGATDYDWAHSKLRGRLRNNRMPPGWEFDITEENRDGPTLDVNGTEVRAVPLLQAWVEAGAPETEAFGDYGATFDDNIQPLFTTNGLWFEGAQACTGCHFANSEASYHEMDLSSYAGIMTGGDALSEPPGVPILGHSEFGATDYDWAHSKLRERLRNNRMPPGSEFDITEENRDGPWVLSGERIDDIEAAMAAAPTASDAATAGSPTFTTSTTTTTVTEPDGTTTTTTTTVTAHYGEMTAIVGSDDQAGACGINAVDLLGAWADSGAPEIDLFDYVSVDGNDCSGDFETDILPLFTTNGLWFEGAQACTGCHFANSEASYHEMDLSSYEGIMIGGDALSEPPGVPILGQSEFGATDYDWAHSKLRGRLRNNRMPPGWEFDITEENRDGPTLDVNGTEVRAVPLLQAWVEAGAPETDTFGDYAATFDANIQPLFTTDGLWFEGAQACTGCHFANSENSYHEMDLSSYAGIMTGADALSEPPGVPILGNSEVGATDYDWDHSKLKERLRNNRMPPGWEFDITEENRDGPLVEHGALVGADMAAGSAMVGEGECEVTAVDLLGAWVEAGSPELDAFAFAALDGAECSGTFDADIQPLFTTNGLWFEGAQACTGCHFANSENSYHEMDLSSYEGIMIGGDALSEPPGVPILGQSEFGATDYDWAHSKLRGRLRNNRMPPGWEFDITEENRDGPTLDVNGTEVRAVPLLQAWVEAGAPQTDAFGDYAATFDANIQPLFTTNGLWFEGAQACTGCHFANSEVSYHEMDLSSYAGIMTGADALSEPPGVPILGNSEVGATDYDWDHSKLKERLRNNRMPPGWEFDITEENRDGPVILAGTK